jgi:hypothetical protein
MAGRGLDGGEGLGRGRRIFGRPGLLEGREEDQQPACKPPQPIPHPPSRPVATPKDLKLLHQIETLANSRGLVALSPSPDAVVLACPGLHTGQVRVELYDRRQTRFISAHNTALAALALSGDGKRLATCSDKGTLVRVWNTADGTKLQELRRGSQPATIHSIALSRHCEWLAVSSDKDTVHVWALSAAVATGREEPEGGGGAAGGGSGGGAAGAGGEGTKNAGLAVISAFKVRGWRGLASDFLHANDHG